MNKLNIAIDGPAASGKGTVAKRIAKLLNLQYIDTGAMFRAVALFGQRHGIAWTDEAALSAIVASMSFSFEWNGEMLSVFVNGEAVTKEIRTESVGVGASQVSAHPLVRAALLKRQQALAEQGGVVMDGRDIGTVVLPNAEIKIFLEADLDVRAARRHEELRLRGEASTLSDVKEKIAQRDLQDSTRSTAPLAKAIDAIVVDSSRLTVDQVVAAILNVIECKTPNQH